jgi:hypothetical protein
MLTVTLKETSIPNELPKFLQTAGINNQVLKPSNVQKQTLLYGSENWILKEKDKSRITAAEKKFFMNTAKYSLTTKGIKIS